MKHTALIVPAFSDVAGQCRIVAKDGKVRDALRNYRSKPDEWRDVGLMNSRGELVCCEDMGTLRAELKDCSPLSAGLVIDFEYNATADTDASEARYFEAQTAEQERRDTSGLRDEFGNEYGDVIYDD